jgi:hypothetical protein
MDGSITTMLFIAAVLIGGGVLFAIVSLSRRGSVLNVEKYRSRWIEIEGQLDRNNPQTFSLCILHADSLLDKALRERGISGKTMGERMRQMQGKWTNGNGVWAAHKIRNRIAHEPETINLDYERTKQALIAFKQALKDVGAI